MTVGDLGARLSAAELTEWMAYDRLDPIGPERADLGAAIVAATVANVHRGRGQAPFRPADFMPQSGNRETTLATAIKGAFAAFAGHREDPVE